LPLNGRAIGLGRAASEVLHMIGRHRLIILSANLRLSFGACIEWCSIELTTIEGVQGTTQQPKAE
jgi:hypothetical protein